MNNDRKSVIATFVVIVVISGLITLGIALTMTAFSLFVMSVIEIKRCKTANEESSDLLWRNDVF